MTEKELTSYWISKLSAAGVSLFPGSFLEHNDHPILRLPGKALVIGEEFFGAYEILTVDGTSFLQAEDYITAKYIVYANRDRLPAIPLPADTSARAHAVAAYEKYLDSLVKKIDAGYKKNFPSGKNPLIVINDVFRALNLIRY